MPTGATTRLEREERLPVLVESDVTSGSDRFTHGFFTIGARSPAFASTHTDDGLAATRDRRQHVGSVARRELGRLELVQNRGGWARR